MSTPAEKIRTPFREPSRGGALPKLPLKMIPRRSSPAGLAAHLALLVAVLVTGSCAQEPPARYPHVVLISLDTLRADHLGCYGNETVATPGIDALASESTLFRSASTVVPTTLASHTTMMTGLYPRKHGVVRNGFMLNHDNVMLAEVLKEEGFHTAGFLGSFALDRVFDFNAGFDHFDQEFTIEYDPKNADQVQRRAEAVSDAVFSHLDEIDVEGERLFLFVHYFDAHAPFDPPEPYGAKYAREGGPIKSDFADLGVQERAHQEALIGGHLSAFQMGLSPELVHGADGKPLPGDDDLAALYAGEVTYLDHHVGQLLDGLRERGILDDAIVILTGDHGETFWEHGDFWHHGAWVYETNLHVPLIVRMPDGRGRGQEVGDHVATIDLFPTILDLLEIPLPEEVDGISLAGALEGQALPVRPIYCEATQPIVAEQLKKGLIWGNQFKAKCVRIGRWKYIYAPYLKGLDELYDLENDPEERVDLIRQPTPESQAQIPALKRALNQWMVKPQPRSSAFNRTQLEYISARLEALGYVDSGSTVDTLPEWMGEK